MTETLKYYVNNKYVESKTTKFYDVYNPSTGELQAKCPRCTPQEAKEAIEAAHKAYAGWSATPPIRRAQVLFRMRDLLDRHMDELTMLCAKEHGKNWVESQGDILKAKEATEHATGICNLLMGESLMDASKGYDTTLYREPLGVFVGIAPFNFPAMIPLGWMAPLCIACGNTMVLKVAGATPMTSLRAIDLYREAGLPEGVLNIISCDREAIPELVGNPLVKGVTFVGSTSVGQKIYAQAAAAGKRVQCLTEAKNHALVLADAPIDRTAAGIINATYGCAGERCMALPVVVAEEAVADRLVAKLLELSKKMKVGPAYDKETQLGPVYSAEHMKSVCDWIAKGVEEGAKLVLDGRGCVVKGHEKGFYVGPTILDHVTPEMTVGQREIFGPVLCVKRCKSFADGLRIMNDNPFANGSVIYTQNGFYAREFARHTHGGMVGVNVGIPVPVGFFPFAGHKLSFFGDLHCLGKDGIRFYTESKCVTTHWFDEDEMKSTKVSTWDGTI